MPDPNRRAELPAALRTALDAALAKGARAPVLLHVTELVGYTDYVLLLSGRSERHVSGITDGILDALRQQGRRPWGSDGLRDHRWDLLDFDDFLVHVFYHPVRLHFDLESMLRDAPRVPLDLPPEAMDTADLDRLRVPDELPSFHGEGGFGGFEDEFEDEFDDEADDEFDDESDDESDEEPDDEPEDELHDELDDEAEPVS
jgi:ribosome silencing factor RsfS/YbeB/iojap